MSRNAIIQRGLQFLDRREHFLPINPAALQEKMLQDARLAPREKVLLAKLFEMIGQRFHMEFRARLEHLKAVYEPFDPDLDTVGGNGRCPHPRTGAETSVAFRSAKERDFRGAKGDNPTVIGSPVLTSLPSCRTRQAGEGTEADGDKLSAQRAELARSFEQLLLDANYQEMAHEQIVACTEYQANRNITVRASFGDYADLRIFYRGVRHQSRKCRTWRAPWRGKEESIHVFARLALLVRLHKRQPESVFVKLFKNVVAEDLEMLLPYVRIRMKMFDRMKIGTSVVGGLATASWKACNATEMSPYVLLALGAGFAGACINGLTNFVASKTRYIQRLTASLYFQNLANNQSMFAHVIDSAEGEQCKELLLAYFLLYIERDRDFDREQLDRRAEQWLAAEFGVTVDFDISGAVQKLIDKELVVEVPRSAASSPERAVLKVYDLPSALHRLDDAWEECLENGELLAANEQRLADADWPPFAEKQGVLV